MVHGSGLAVDDAVNVVREFVARGLMPDPRDLVVWDLGCGQGEFTQALRQLGANAFGSDLVVHRLSDADPAIVLVEGGFQAVVDHLGGDAHSVDLVFLHLMTEHVDKLDEFFLTLRDVLRPGAEAFIQHDNYFQPVGHHDHGFLELDPENCRIAERTTYCWMHGERCSVSADHRRELSDTLPWLWSTASESTKDPDDCESCNYFRRSRPWAHLLYGRDLQRTFPEEWFRLNLNRASTNQLLWCVQDAGFEIVHEERSWLRNVPPESLLLEHGLHSLTSFTTSLRLRRLP